MQKGFTLIELLVVVLIIGILAAVAVPQYQKAVNKSRFATLQIAANSFGDAIEAYHLANGIWPANFDELALDLPAGMTPLTAPGSASCTQDEQIYCCLTPKYSGYDAAIVCGRRDYSFAFHVNVQTHTKYCVAKLTNEKAKKLCQSMGPAYSEWGFFTPEGSKSGYMYYTL